MHWSFQFKSWALTKELHRRMKVKVTTGTDMLPLVVLVEQSFQQILQFAMKL